jgi:hypothetical protein
MISGASQGQLWKLLVGAFGFLQANDVWIGFSEPAQEPILSPSQRIDVPGDYFHSP